MNEDIQQIIDELLREHEDEIEILSLSLIKGAIIKKEVDTMKKKVIFSSVIIVTLVLTTLGVIKYIDFNKTWAVESFNLNDNDFPLKEEKAIRIAERYTEGYLRTKFSSGVDESPWDPVPGIKWSNDEHEDIDVVQDEGNYFKIEFRHRGDFCKQLFINIEKESGNILKKESGDSGSKACE
ncbi:hypothetical protein ACKXGF_04370 [Alkalibacillus sp. S2W]|uniref:hypothetical protein n=1 Tax=Alkalibacillus sp. S2W TaxID=3386553 RepID=UPI00398D403E